MFCTGAHQIILKDQGKGFRFINLFRRNNVGLNNTVPLIVWLVAI